ncbi:MAG: hypothetical protein JKY03_00980 [Aureispira sp.]|nr:hypothetical protein [Aureispira sp.]
MNVKNELMSIADVNTLIESGKSLTIAGEEHLLKQLSKGNWVGGTTPYFMNHDGGVINQEQVFMTDFTEVGVAFKIGVYDSQQILKEMLEDRYVGGFSYVLLPAFSEIHQSYALNNRDASTLFDVPTIGWVMGVHLDDIGQKTAKVINGQTGVIFENKACVLHCKLPEGAYAEIDIVNVYEQGEGDKITFLENSFTCQDCLINGESANLAEYYIKNKIDVSLPLVANYSGVSINVSIQQVDEVNKQMVFYAPVLTTEEYQIAKPVPSLYDTFESMLPSNTADITCSFNCILNYLGLELEGKKLGDFRGPFTFGEIAYVLVNQTMVTLSIQKI